MDKNIKTFDKKDFIENFSKITGIPAYAMKIVVVEEGSTIVKLEILAFEKNNQKYTVRALAENITEKEACKRLVDFSVYLVEFGKPDENFKPKHCEIIMNPKFNREYGPQKINWSGTLNQDKVEPYYGPSGWKKFTCKVADSAEEFDEKYKSWPVAYHGTNYKLTMMISYSRLRSGYHTPGKGVMVFGDGVYFTPSIIYASHPRYANPKKLTNGKWGQMVLNFRLRPGSYDKHQETLGVGNKYKIDPNYDNSEVEWLVKVP